MHTEHIHAKHKLIHNVIIVQDFRMYARFVQIYVSLILEDELFGVAGGGGAPAEPSLPIKFGLAIITEPEYFRMASQAD